MIEYSLMSVSAGIISVLQHRQLCICWGYLWLNVDGLYIPLRSIRSPNEKATLYEFVMHCEEFMSTTSAWLSVFIICFILWQLTNTVLIQMAGLYCLLDLNVFFVQTLGLLDFCSLLHQSSLYRNLRKPKCKRK